MKNIIRLLSIVLIISIFLTMFSFTGYASEIKKNVLTMQQRKESVFNYKINEMSKDQKLTINCIKSAIDFSGNNYSIIECSPIGYLVYCDDAGVFVEYSPTSYSPYLNKTGVLYYCGPTFYYTENSRSNTVEHTILENENISISKIGSYIQNCDVFYNYIMSQQNSIVLNYIKNENNTKSFSEVAADYSTRAETVGRLSNYRFFYDMDDPCGYYCPSGSGGICGYIGLSLIIGYRDKYRDNNYMSNTYWQNSSTKNNLIDGSNSLAAHLRNKHGSSDSTDSNKIKAVSQSYFKGRNLDVTHTSKIWGTFNRNTIMDAIDADNPVLLFGSLEDPSDNGKSILHAVVAYKYTDESGIFGSTVYTAHFGWNNYSNIFVYGTIGSIYILD